MSEKKEKKTAEKTDADIQAGIAALAVGLVVAWINGDLFLVAVSCCATVFVTALFF